MKNILFTLTLFITATAAKPQNVVVLDSTLVHVEVVIDSSIINDAWDIEWGPDDHLWIGNSEYMMRYNTVTTQLDTVLHKPAEFLLGIDVHPDFPDTNYVFAVVATASYYGGSNLANVYRYEWDGSALINETLLLTYPHAGEHCGGRVVVTQDNKLLLTTADYFFGGGPLKGRTLRMNLDGSIPVDNPNPNEYEWTSGHRNPQGLTQLPNGLVYNSEHGQADNDEVNLLVAGGHYGWPAYDGNNCSFLVPDSCNSQTYSYIPAKSITPSPPSGAEYYNHPAIPEFGNSILVGTLWGAMSLDAHSLNTAGDSVTHYRKYLNVPSYGRVRDMATAPDGSVYFIGFDRQAPNAVYRVYNPNYIPAGQSETAIAPALNLAVYPNPTNGTVTVSANSKGMFTLHGLSGRTLGTYPLNQAINLSPLPAGIYLVRYGSHTKKLVVQE